MSVNVCKRMCVEIMSNYYYYYVNILKPTVLHICGAVIVMQT